MAPHLIARPERGRCGAEADATELLLKRAIRVTGSEAPTRAAFKRCAKNLPSRLGRERADGRDGPLLSATAKGRSGSISEIPVKFYKRRKALGV